MSFLENKLTELIFYQYRAEDGVFPWIQQDRQIPLVPSILTKDPVRREFQVDPVDLFADDATLLGLQILALEVEQNQLQHCQVDTKHAGGECSCGQHENTRHGCTCEPQEETGHHCACRHHGQSEDPYACSDADAGEKKKCTCTGHRNDDFLEEVQKEVEHLQEMLRAEAKAIWAPRPERQQELEARFLEERDFAGLYLVFVGMRAAQIARTREETVEAYDKESMLYREMRAQILHDNPLGVIEDELRVMDRQYALVLQELLTLRGNPRDFYYAGEYVEAQGKYLESYLYYRRASASVEKENEKAAIEAGIGRVINPAMLEKYRYHHERAEFAEAESALMSMDEGIPREVGRIHLKLSQFQLDEAERILKDAKGKFGQHVAFDEAEKSIETLKTQLFTDMKKN